jgi:hypothetical protein
MGNLTRSLMLSLFLRVFRWHNKFCNLLKITRSSLSEWLMPKNRVKIDLSLVWAITRLVSRPCVNLAQTVSSKAKNVTNNIPLQRSHKSYRLVMIKLWLTHHFNLKSQKRYVNMALVVNTKKLVNFCIQLPSQRLGSRKSAWLKMTTRLQSRQRLRVI